VLQPVVVGNVAGDSPPAINLVMFAASQLL